MSDNNKNTTVTASFSFSTLGFILFVVFLILKLVDVLTISWFWVFFPLWAPLALDLLILLIIFIVALIINRNDDKKLGRK